MKKNVAKTSNTKLNVALLILRVGIGAMFIGHGLPKLMAGPEMWAKIGGAMAILGVTGFPEFWGFMAAVAEGVGGALLILGLFTVPAGLMMAFTMVIAALVHITGGDGIFTGASHAIELFFVFIFLSIAGAGSYSADHKLFK
jgi:putative oxidoreductase